MLLIGPMNEPIFSMNFISWMISIMKLVRNKLQQNKASHSSIFSGLKRSRFLSIPLLDLIDALSNAAANWVHIIYPLCY